MKLAIKITAAVVWSVDGMFEGASIAEERELVVEVVVVIRESQEMVSTTGMFEGSKTSFALHFSFPEKPCQPCSFAAVKNVTI